MKNCHLPLHPEPEPGATCPYLTRLETKLLSYLNAHVGRTVSRQQLLADVWQLNPQRVLTRTVDMHIAKLRSKLPACQLVTIRGEGYMCILTQGADEAANQSDEKFLDEQEVKQPAICRGQQRDYD